MENKYIMKKRKQNSSSDSVLQRGSGRGLLFLKEIKYRLGNFTLGVLGVVTAVAIVVFFVVMTKASRLTCVLFPIQPI